MNSANPAVDTVQSDVIGSPGKYAATDFSQLQDGSIEFVAFKLSGERLLPWSTSENAID
ncbi:MAG TPA: hypothetical protein VEK84_15500 [Terriglobales bacterium]|nr:hypothetical protein [Terriglobales bacterium]